MSNLEDYKQDLTKMYHTAYLTAFDDILEELWGYVSCKTATQKVQNLKTKYEMQLETGIKQ